MKKLLAFALALMLALGCVPAVAEEAQGLPAFTAVSEMEINEEALAAVLPALGMDESAMPVLQMFVPLLSNLKETLVFDGSAAELAFLLKDVPVATVTVREDDAAAELVSSLIPSYKLVASKETVDALMSQLSFGGDASLDADAFAAEMQAIADKYETAIINTITLGEPQETEFEFNGLTFNQGTPATVDVKALYKIIADIMKDVTSNQTLMGLMSSLGQAGSLDMSQLEANLAEIENAKEEDLPEIRACAFNIVDEDGVVKELPHVIYLLVDTKKEEVGELEIGMYEDGLVESVSVKSETANVQLTVVLDPSDPENMLELDVIFQDKYIAATVGMSAEEGSMTVHSNLYFMDPEKPLLCETVTFTFGDVPAIAFDDEGKTAIALEDMMQDAEGKTVGALLNDLSVNGLGMLLTNAMQAMPEEISGIMGLFMGGAAVEEAPTANE